MRNQDSDSEDFQVLVVADRNPVRLGGSPLDLKSEEYCYFRQLEQNKLEMLIHVLFLTLGTDMGDWMGTIETTGIG